MHFRALVELGGKTATGIQVPDDVVESLESGRRPPVRVTVSGHTYRTTVAPMRGSFWVPLSAENREAAGVAAGDEVDVRIEADDEPREVTVPSDLADSIATNHAARDFFEALSYSYRKEWVRWVEEARKPTTRRSRIEKTVESLAAGNRTH